MYMNLKAIDTVHQVKTTFLDAFIKDERLNKSLTQLVDAEAQFGKSIVTALSDIQFKISDAFYKPATWLKS